MKQYIKKEYILLIAILLVVATPLVIAKLMDIQVFSWMKSDNDWIGFWGGYLGGICTLAGVNLTIRQSKKEALENQRISIMPYFAVISDEIIEEDIPIIRISLHNIPIDDEERKSYKYYIDELIIEGIFKSVGMGNATNCKIEAIIVENKKTKYPTGTESVVLQGQETPFYINLHRFGLHDDDITERFRHEYTNYYYGKELIPRQPGFLISFEMKFEDVIGNKYRQHVVYRLPILEKDTFDFLAITADFETIDRPFCYDAVN